MYRFGPFCLNAKRRILTKDGIRIQLSDKCIDTLAALLARAGETITKNDLIDAVWGHSDVEENSLSQAISMVRKALGERRGDHVYIVTETGVGYRFIAPVFRGASAAGDVPATSGHRLRICAAITAVLALSAATYAVYHLGAAPAKRRIAVILALQGLPGTSDSAWISTAVGEMLFHELAAGPALDLIPPEDAARMQRELPRRATTAEAMRDIRMYSGADLALEGTVTVLSGEPGRPLRIDLHVQDLRTGGVVATASVDGSEAQTFQIVRTLADRLRPALGLPAVAGRKGPTVTASAQSMELYAAGLTALRSSDPLAARDRLLEAVQADPSNALCYSALADAWSALGYDNNAANAAQRAYQLSSPLDRLERLAIEGKYRMALHDWRAAAGIYEAIWKTVPDSIEDARALVQAYAFSGRTKDAEAVIAALRRLPAPVRDDPRIDLMEARTVGATWSGYRRIAVLAAQAAEKAKGRQMRDLYAHARLLEAGAMQASGEAGFAEIRTEARRICEALQDSLCVAQALRVEGNLYLTTGRAQQARESYDRSLEIARKIGNAGEQLNDLNGLGLLEWASGNFAKSDGVFRELLSMQEDLRTSATETSINYAGMLTAAGRLEDARAQLETALRQARAFHEVQSEANSLAELAQIERIGGKPRSSVALARQSLALAKQSGSMETQLWSGLGLALSLAAVGEAGAAKEALNNAESQRYGHELEFDVAAAAVQFELGNYADAARRARLTVEAARSAQAREYETRAEALLARALLALGQREEARSAALGAQEAEPDADRALSRQEAALAQLATSGASAERFSDLAVRSRNSGYIQLDLEVRLAAARQVALLGRKPEATRLLQEVQSEASGMGYLALAAKAKIR